MLSVAWLLAVTLGPEQVVQQHTPASPSRGEVFYVQAASDGTQYLVAFIDRRMSLYRTALFTSRVRASDLTMLDAHGKLIDDENPLDVRVAQLGGAFALVYQREEAAYMQIEWSDGSLVFAAPEQISGGLCPRVVASDGRFVVLFYSQFQVQAVRYTTNGVRVDATPAVVFPSVPYATCPEAVATPQTPVVRVATVNASAQQVEQVVLDARNLTAGPVVPLTGASGLGLPTSVYVPGGGSYLALAHGPDGEWFNVSMETGARVQVADAGQVWAQSMSPGTDGGALLIASLGYYGVGGFAVRNLAPTGALGPWSPLPSIGDPTVASANGGTEVLVVGSEPYFGYVRSLAAIRLELDGRVRDSMPARVSRAGTAQFHPEVVAGDNQFLVAWTVLTDWSGFGTDVYFRRFDKAGAPLEVSPVKANVGSRARRPRALWTGSEFVLAYNTEVGVAHRMVSVQGALGPEWFGATYDTGSATPFMLNSRPALAYIDSSGAVVWSPLNTDGGALQPRLVAPRRSSSFSDVFAVADDSGGALLVWEGPDQPFDGRVWAGRLAPSGTLLDPDGGLSISGPLTGFRPVAARDGQGFWVTFSNYSSFFSTRVVGNQVGVPTAVASSAAIGSSLLPGPGGALALWVSQNPSDVSGAWMRSRGLVVDAGAPFNVLSSSPRHADLAAAGSGPVMVAYTSFDDGPNATGVKTRLLFKDPLNAVCSDALTCESQLCVAGRCAMVADAGPDAGADSGAGDGGTTGDGGTAGDGGISGDGGTSGDGGLDAAVPDSGIADAGSPDGGSGAEGPGLQVACACRSSPAEAVLALALGLLSRRGFGGRSRRGASAGRSV